MSKKEFNNQPGVIFDNGPEQGKWKVWLPILGKKVVVDESHFAQYHVSSSDICNSCGESINLNAFPTCHC
eukprot:1205089-Karenia_brevis.AAC.1